MSHPSRGAVLWAAATLVVVVALVEGVAARGGGRGGGGGGRGGGGFSRGGPAARGSFGQNRPADGMDRGEYDARGPAADGSFGMQYPNHGERQERRQERREERQDTEAVGRNVARIGRSTPRTITTMTTATDGDYYEDEGPLVYWTLPCQPNVIALGGVIYYVCDSTWYIRAYSDGEVVYTVVPNPTGH